jgi:DNA polymerase III subunit gamma/tau
MQHNDAAILLLDLQHTMDRFIVSARKYRPQTFDTVVGQGHITTTLKNAIKHQQLAHAFLFCGPRGVGKTTCARILAKTINCENQTKEGEACNKCNSCVSFNEGTSMNIHELDAASNNSVDDIRTLVEQVRFAPQAGRYKVYIIDEVHMLSSSAFNAFLKTLEEPPPYAIFILATTEKHKILPTILSRCQIFDFKRITTNDTVEHLQEICDKEKINAEKAALQVIAQKSEGCMRDALSILDKIVSFTNGTVNYQNTLEHLNILDADYYFKLMDCMQQQDLAGTLLLYDDIDRKGFEGDLVINGYAEFIRNILVCKDEKVAVLLETVEGFKDRYLSTAQKISTAYLISALNVLNEAEINYKGARNKRLHVELALIKLCYLQQALELSNSTEGVGKKKVTDTAQAVAFRNLVIKEGKTQNAERKTTRTEQKVQHAEAKLMIENVVEESVYEYEAGNKSARTPSEKPVEENQQSEQRAQNTEGKNQKTEAKIGSLVDNIRKKYANKQNGNGESKIVLEQQKLQDCWNAFSQLLKENKNPAAASFDMARLQVTGEGSFEVYSNNNLEQKFIEQERIGLSAHLQQTFNNRSIMFTIIIDSNNTYQEPVDRPLNTREQFIRIAEQYPLVKELKDRLKLDLDY